MPIGASRRSPAARARHRRPGERVDRHGRPQCPWSFRAGAAGEPRPNSCSYGWPAARVIGARPARPSSSAPPPPCAPT